MASNGESRVANPASRRLPAIPGVSLTFNIPILGSLGPIEGAVAGLARPQDYKFCIYLTSTASGQVLTNGPKPFENDDSSAAIDASGAFTFNDWYANLVYDTVVGTFTGFVFPNSAGNCIPYLGVVIPGGLLPASAQATASVAYTAYTRANTASISSIDISSPLVIRGVLTGLPTDIDAQPLLALVYSRSPVSGIPGVPFQFTGPLGVTACGQSSGAIVTRAGDGTGTFSIPCTGACAAAQDLTVVITSGAKAQAA